MNKQGHGQQGHGHGHGHGQGHDRVEGGTTTGAPSVAGAGGAGAAGRRSAAQELAALSGLGVGLVGAAADAREPRETRDPRDARPKGAAVKGTTPATITAPAPSSQLHHHHGAHQQTAPPASLLRRKLNWSVLPPDVPGETQAAAPTLKRPASVIGSFLSNLGFASRSSSLRHSLSATPVASAAPAVVQAAPQQAAQSAQPFLDTSLVNKDATLTNRPIDTDTQQSIPQTAAHQPALQATKDISRSLTHPNSALTLNAARNNNNNNNSNGSQDFDQDNDSLFVDSLDHQPPRLLSVSPAQKSLPHKQFHNIAWAVKSELGYRNMLSASPHPNASNLVTTEFVRIPIHNQIEDIHWPSQQDRLLWSSNGLGSDHVKFGFHFSDGGVVTSEYDNTWKKAQLSREAAEDMMDDSENKFGIISETSSIFSVSTESTNSCSDADSLELDESIVDSHIVASSRGGGAAFSNSDGFHSITDDLMDQDDENNIQSRLQLEQNLSSTSSSALSIASSDTESTLSSTQSIRDVEPTLSSIKHHHPNHFNLHQHNNSSHSHDQHLLHGQLRNLHNQQYNPLPNTESTRLFILADGHGGILASKFFVPRTKTVLGEILESRDWDFGVAMDRSLFEQKACEAFKIIDAEYCAIQVARYRTWVDSGSIPAERPDDDGCALVAVVVHNSWLVNLNVGDSRMTLISRPKDSHSPHWNTVFTSVDHNMTHPGKVYSIYTSGGHFMSPSHTLIPMNPQHPSVRKDQPYHELTNARIYRHASAAVKSVGVSHRRTLNLTGTMGDLLFKIEPAVLNGIPDVSFIELDTAWEYVMVLATDGIWDHLMDNSGDAERHTVMVMSVVSAAIDGVERERDDNLKEWEAYREAKQEWIRTEKERKVAAKERRREEKRARKLARAAAAAAAAAAVAPALAVVDATVSAAAATATVASAVTSIVTESIAGGHGKFGDVAAAAEPEQVQPSAGSSSAKWVLGVVSGSDLVSASTSEGDDTTSDASSNGSTAVASKEHSLNKKRSSADNALRSDDMMATDDDDDDDEVQDEENLDEEITNELLSLSKEEEQEGSSMQMHFAKSIEDLSEAAIAPATSSKAIKEEEISQAAAVVATVVEKLDEEMDISDCSMKPHLDLDHNTKSRHYETATAPPKKPAYFDFNAVLESRLQQVARVLVEREMSKSTLSGDEDKGDIIHETIQQAMQNLFWQKQIRYDDATAFVAYFG
ncbi:hypothetical protein HK100_010508 [Physocladia obscura]|uniref:PPM-type phosphatase domain-containing protein n=1 Tax=Physocladia obscura TaxID=109957 RepID=A0AAD5T367_9FUNG|nr:hypothetical protein HK100_010508 [Physocladia obscura]